ncbi:hypothetical protein SASPL_117976 [Salvia splendens]|uniref:Protein FAR1-RELATED SEQUENCE n=1 Tax=Salvia splendens TaxID=180675 RepID=A0A8X8ZZG4_SALSN|nr:hypothetical protein SASPL_117976 [Salvia splendens]
MDETISQGIIPEIGMEFETEVEAYDVYMKYAKATCFGTRKKTVHKDPITVDVAQSCGLRPKKIVDVMAKEVGGIQHLGFTHIDLKNYLRTKRTLEIKQALLYDETIETFEWLFGAFEDAMMGKRPKTILTDQDQAMSAALASKWLSTYHRLCVWHIFQNAAIHLSSVFSSFKNTFAADFSRCLYDFEEESEFLDAWNKMLEKFNLKDNQWLARMFSLMEKWALVYGRSTFYADIITTQRSECMNAVVKHYVNYKNNIVEVFRHFQRLIDDRREKESIEDFKNAQSSPVMTFPLEILKHAAIVYTHKMFALFSEELRKAFESKIERKTNNVHNTMGNDIDGMAGKTNNVTVEANKVGDISTNGDINESQIKGVKPKGRVTYQSSKKRPKNALEQAISRKRKPKVAKSGLKHVSSTQEYEGSKLINNEYWNLTYNVFDNQTKNIGKNVGDDEELSCDIDVNCYPSESEESDNELIDTELFDENDSVVKEKNIVVYDDITKLLDGCVGHDDNENIFRLCKLCQQCAFF